jgi:hypothetical protein
MTAQARRKEVAMMLLIKKIGGLGLFLIGGLIAAHGGSDGRGWEVFLGLVVAVIGGALLAAKIMRRNSEPMETLSRRD